jgi:hypothetical protein
MVKQVSQQKTTLPWHNGAVFQMVHIVYSDGTEWLSTGFVAADGTTTQFGGRDVTNGATL